MLKSSITREEVEKALGPVWDWYQSDEHESRPLPDILRDVSADLQQDRKEALHIRRLFSNCNQQISNCPKTKDYYLSNELGALRRLRDELAELFK